MLTQDATALPGGGWRVGVIMKPVRLAAAVGATLVLIACAGPGGVAKPQVQVKIAGTIVPAAMGSYCWSSGGQGQCVDMASMHAVAQTRGLTPTHVLAASPGTITFDRYPRSLDLMAGSDEAHLQAVPMDAMSFQAPSTPGVWEYLLSGRWDQGDVTWVFLISV